MQKMSQLANIGIIMQCNGEGGNDNYDYDSPKWLKERKPNGPCWSMASPTNLVILFYSKACIEWHAAIYAFVSNNQDLMHATHEVSAA